MVTQAKELKLKLCKLIRFAERVLLPQSFAVYDFPGRFERLFSSIDATDIIKKKNQYKRETFIQRVEKKTYKYLTERSDKQKNRLAVPLTRKLNSFIIGRFFE